MTATLGCEAQGNGEGEWDGNGEREERRKWQEMRKCRL